MPEDFHHLSRPPGRSFPTTHWSLVLAAVESHNPESRHALDALCRLYWPPVYFYVRSAGHDVQAARDLTRGFFARLLEKGDLRRADRTRGRFRSFLLPSVKHFVANEWDRARAQRRGGGRSHVPLDIADAEAKYSQGLAEQQTPETIYEKQWAPTAPAIRRAGEKPLPRVSLGLGAGRRRGAAPRGRAGRGRTAEPALPVEESRAAEPCRVRRRSLAPRGPPRRRRGEHRPVRAFRDRAEAGRN